MLAALRADPDTPGPVLLEALDRAQMDVVDADATGSGRQELLQRIAELEGHSGKSVTRRRRELVTRLIAAQALADEWGRQAALMPPAPPAGDVEGRSMLRALGKARGRMARCQVQMLLNRDDPAAAGRWAAKHREAAAESLDLHSQMRMRIHHGHPDSEQLSDQEKAQWRADRVQRPALTLLSHKRAVAAANPAAFDTVVPKPSEVARQSGEVYRGALPPAPTESSTPVEAAAATQAAEGGDVTNAQPAAQDNHPADETTANKAANKAAGREEKSRRRAARRAATIRAADLRRLRMVATRIGMVARKAERGSGTPAFDMGGLFMLDYFTANVK